MNGNAEQIGQSAPALPLDWDHALHAAAARLKEQYVLPETADHPLLAGEVQWLAVLLCAYGRLAEEVDRACGHARTGPLSGLDAAAFVTLSHADNHPQGEDTAPERQAA